MSRLGVAGSRLTPLQALSHPSLWTAGAPTLAPTMAPTLAPTMAPPSVTNPWDGYEAPQVSHMADPQAPRMPSPWLAALMGGITGAADAANETNMLGGLTSTWAKARQMYEEARQATAEQNAQIDRTNATNKWNVDEKRLGFNADVTKTRYDDILKRNYSTWEHGTEGPLRPYDQFQDDLVTHREETIAGLQHRYGLSRLAAEAAYARQTHKLNRDYDLAHPEPPKPVNEGDLLKESDLAYEANNGADAAEMAGLEKIVQKFAGYEDLLPPGTKDRYEQLQQQRENFRRQYIQSRRGGGTAAPQKPTLPAPSQLQNLLQRLAQAGVHDD